MPWIYLITNITVHSRWVIALDVNAKTISHLEENKEIDAKKVDAVEYKTLNDKQIAKAQHVETQGVKKINGTKTEKEFETNLDDKNAGESEIREKLKSNGEPKGS